MYYNREGGRQAFIHTLIREPLEKRPLVRPTMGNYSWDRQNTSHNNASSLDLDMSP
jgi:hypothetical protein